MLVNKHYNIRYLVDVTHSGQEAYQALEQQ